MGLKWISAAIIFSSFLSACGGGESNNNTDPDNGGTPTVPTPTTDTTPPDAPSSPVFNRLNGGKITVIGTAEPASTVTITFADGSTVSAIADAEGNYTATSPNPVLGGSGFDNGITITATDTAGNISTATQVNIPAPPTKTASLVARFEPTVGIIGVPYTTSLYNGSGFTQNNGSFTYKEGETVTFRIAGIDYTVIPKPTTNEVDIAGSDPSTLQNFKLILKNLDQDHDASNGIDLVGIDSNINPQLSTAKVNQLLYKSTGLMPELLFSPSLGINTEAPQAEADTAGQAMPFVDIFRTARPFTELSGNANFDQNGWPTQIDPDLTVARTKMLQGTLDKAIPSGKYTLFYEGVGTIQLGSRIISNVKGFNNQGQLGFTFDLNTVESDSAEANVINLNVKDIGSGEGNYIKNIQLIMPGGTCKDSSDKHNAFIRVESQSDCPANTTYESFANQIKNKNRNNIDSVIFNPDYLNFLREFKVVRMMNLMESSHGTSSCAISNNGVTEIDKECVKEPVSWSNRARISHAVWGGSGRTDHTKRNGVPVEVMVSLANTLERDMWVNMPHYADDEYISSFANYVSAVLNQNLKTYIEYSNETWNPGFLGHFYVEEKGIDAGLNTVPEAFVGFRDEEYFARLRFYSGRAVEIFNLFKEAFNGSTDRMVRVLGTNQGDRILSEQMILHAGAENVDAIAMAPYFFGCVEKTGSCRDADHILKDAKTVDDVFDVIDQDISIDPSALSGTIGKIELQVGIAAKYNLQLLAYEGGQHLTTSIMGRLKLDEENKAVFRTLFKAVNRDARMKSRYQTLLNAWKDFSADGTALFTMYTLPQSYYRFGNWGLKEHLNKSRSESPKYDGVMTFQEKVKSCWWNNCE
jgi:hypothetical protein